jgi:hypothetical protein
MIKSVIVTFAAIGLWTLDSGQILTPKAQDPELQACPGGWSQRVEKIAGTTSGYPASCALPGCRVMNYVAMKTHLEPFHGLPGGYITVVDWRYQVKLGTLPGNACPADVSAGPWHSP